MGESNDSDGDSSVLTKATIVLLLLKMTLRMIGWEQEHSRVRHLQSLSALLPHTIQLQNSFNAHRDPRLTQIKSARDEHKLMFYWHLSRAPDPPLEYIIILYFVNYFIQILM